MVDFGGSRPFVWYGRGKANEHPHCNVNEAEAQQHTQLVWTDHAKISCSNG